MKNRYILLKHDGQLVNRNVDSKFAFLLKEIFETFSLDLKIM